MANTSKTEEYNGTSWSTANDMTAHKKDGAAAGTQTAGLAIGGNPTAQRTVSHEYDGTNWSVSGSLTTARHQHAGWGSQTAAATTGNTSYVTSTETYDGTSWSAADTSPEGKSYSQGCGQATGGTDGLNHGGQKTNSSTYLTSTAKYASSLTVRTVTDS